MITIPMKDLPSFTEEIVLEPSGNPYVLKFNWISRGAFWTMDFYDPEQSPLLLGIRIALRYELISKYPDRGLPPGLLFAVDESENYESIGRDDFVNGRVSLVYVTEDEIATF